jgi:polyisoprenoid-binding protein YceI
MQSATRIVSLLACVLALLISSAGLNPVTAQSPLHVDTQASRVFVLVGATGLGHPHGVEGRLRSGTLTLGAAQNAGELAFDLTSFVAETKTARTYVGLQGESSESDQRKINTNMHGAEVLDVARFNTASFRAVSAVPSPNQRAGQPPLYRITGDLTLHGRTQPIVFDALAENAQNMVHLRGQFKLKQTLFGITPYSKAFGAVGVADELTIWGDLWLRSP